MSRTALNGFPLDDVEKDLGAALIKQVKTTANRGVQHYQHWLYATFRQDNPAAEGYLI